jgi:hypothetical protein
MGGQKVDKPRANQSPPRSDSTKCHTGQLSIKWIRCENLGPIGKHPQRSTAAGVPTVTKYFTHHGTDHPHPKCHREGKISHVTPIQKNDDPHYAQENAKDNQKDDGGCAIEVPQWANFIAPWHGVPSGRFELSESDWLRERQWVSAALKA